MEMAIEDLAMAVHQADEARQFEAARDEHDLRIESSELECDFRPLELESWPD